MTGVGTAQMLLLASLTFWALAGVGCSLMTRFVLRWTRAWAPASRHRALFLLGVAPLVVGLAAITAVMLPSLLGMHWPAQDHCLVHGGHSHLCFVHASHDAGSASGWLIVASVLVLVALRAARAARALSVASRLLRDLVGCARQDAERNVWLVPSLEKFFLSAGLLRPKLIASIGLVEASSRDELEIMLLHERAHARRKDNLVRLIARATTWLLWPRARRALLEALELAAEQACDEEAAARVGDRLRVAETILAVERRLASPGLALDALAAGFGASSVPQRVEAMLEPERTASACALVSIALAAVVGGLLGAHDFLHHATESLLAIFSH